MYFGVFPNPREAQTAHDALNERASELRWEPERVHMVVHEYDVRQKALRRTGGIAWPLAIFSALLFGGVAAAALTLFVRGAFGGAPAQPEISRMDPTGVVLLSVGAAVLGGLLAAILTHMAIRARISRLENELAEGRAVLLVVGPKRRRRDIMQAMSNVGAVRTGAF
ncbi:hypothetical protein ENSA7_52240 [Enhygromyxa salina]|uniref:Uncharacterized protein n=2 Tax=Enhygromyxa salina TaxID=215803 RepID=A0A2S9YFP8_9BACT|nr:hypothetical protein ENSA7_52240 [Enhygromyxa salina]